MNTTVTADGMAVTAKADNTFLIISAGNTLSGNAITATGTLNGTLYPTKPVDAWSAANVAQIETVTNWGTASSSSLSDANTSANVTALPGTATFGDYVAKQSFMVGRAADTTEPANDLRMKSITFSTTVGVTAVVVCGTNVYTYSATDAALTSKLADAAAVTTSGVQVDVYIYIDGSNSAVYTNNIANLTGTVEMAFTVDAAA